MFGLMGLLFGAACGGGTGPTPPDPADCTSPLPVTLAVGAHQVVDPAGSGGCLRVGGATADEEYLLAVVSGSGLETQSGVSGPYTLSIGAVGQVAPGARQAAGGGPAAAPAEQEGPDAAARFDHRIRQLEAGLVVPPGAGAGPPAAPAPAPVVGEQRSFQVCATDACTSTNTVNATARAVGATVAIYADEANVQFGESFQEADYAELVSAFDNHLHPLAREAFGSESDIDGNGMVLVLVTRRVNDFTTNCAKGRVIGYFYGGDLLPSLAGSNRAELFFTYAPAPATTQCPAVTRRGALNQLKPTLIHEFQHMISFNQHRLIRSSNQEETWLNEALSHLAEDLAGQLIPNSECPGATSCRSLYGSPNLLNAYSAMGNLEQHALVFARSSTGTLAERGVGFLFARWLLDQYGSGTNGFTLSRALLATTKLGRANIEAVTGQGFATLVGEWQLANYLDDLAGFADLSGRLAFDTWDFRTVMTNPANSGLFPNGYPLLPLQVTQALTRSGVLRAGTGRHVILRAGGTPRDVLLSAEAGSPNQPDPALAARIAIARIR